MARTLVLADGAGARCRPRGAAAAAAPQGEQPLPRFRAGASLVRLDAYVSVNGAAVTDLDSRRLRSASKTTRAQKVESFELIRAREARGDPHDGPPTPASTQEQRAAAQDPNARLFVLYLDRWHVGLDGSFRSAAPVEAFLDKVVGPNDLVGVMTPDITPQNMTLVRKGAASIARCETSGIGANGIDSIRRTRTRTGFAPAIPIRARRAGIAKEMVERRREQQTLRSLDGMVRYLDGLREERKFVLLLSEGWVQFRRNDQLGRPLGGQVPGGPDGVGVGPDGRLTTGARQAAGGEHHLRRVRARARDAVLHRPRARSAADGAARQPRQRFVLSAGSAWVDRVRRLDWRRLPAELAVTGSRAHGEPSGRPQGTGGADRRRVDSQHQRHRRCADAHPGGYELLLSPQLLLDQPQARWPLPAYHGPRQTAGRRRCGRVRATWRRPRPRRGPPAPRWRARRGVRNREWSRRE